MIWVAGLVLVYLILAAGLVLGYLRVRGQERPRSTPPEPNPPWQSDPGAFARCPGCGTLRPVEGGLIAGHDRPDPWVPYDQASARCFGTGLPPADTGDAQPSTQPEESER
ncbi:MAG: hypothetical protein M3P18_09815 [Actinomycetota bacterium]|nr:hypothetical protein [Actinomycetota bacterium]